MFDFGLSAAEITALGTVASTLFGGLWTLVKKLIFDPLQDINDNLKDMKEIMVKAEVRLERLEVKEEDHETRLKIIETKLIQQ
jgi:hypothetical protein